MCYLEKIEYEIVPKDSLPVLHNCSGCNRKTVFQNTKKFRVNANGNRLDVWLIYQCGRCKHTYNLAVYERAKVSSIPEKEYQRFLANDEELAETYGRNFRFFQKNKAEVDLESLDYQFVRVKSVTDSMNPKGRIEITVHNPYGLKVRPEKQIAEILGLSRSQIKKLMELGDVTVMNISSQAVCFCVKDHLVQMENDQEGRRERTEGTEGTEGIEGTGRTEGIERKQRQNTL